MKITYEDFAMLAKISHKMRNWFSLALVSQGLRNSFFSASQGLRNFTRVRNSFFIALLSILQLVLLLGISHALQKFRIAMRNCWMLDLFSDSLLCILDWFGKGYKALQNSDSSCNLTLTCFAMDYTKFSLILGLF